MSGKDGIRGYIYQTIISVIKALTIPDWEFVKIEPQTKNDKVDILWENQLGEKTVQQVKSSENNFPKPAIIRMLESLIKDEPEAKRFELILVGSFASDTVNFINAINKNKNIVTDSSIINEHVQKIRIEKVIFSTSMMESSIRDSLSQFLSNLGFSLSHQHIALLADGLLSQFLLRSIINEKTSKKEVIDDLLKWVKFNYPRINLQLHKQAALSLKFYNISTNDFSCEIEALSFQFKHLSFINTQKEKVLAAYKECDTLVLPPRKKIEENLNDLTKQSNFIIPSFLNKSEPADFPKSLKEFVFEKMYKYFNIDVTDSLFFVGELIEKDPYNLLKFMNGPSYIGSDDEKIKRQLLSKLYWELKTLDECIQFLEFMEGFYTLPIILENTGETYDEEVSITIDFPDYVNVLTEEDLYVPEDKDAIYLLIENDFFEDYLVSKSDSFIEAYPRLKVPRSYEAIHSMKSIFMFDSKGEKKYLQKCFRNEYSKTFDYEVFYDVKGVIKIKCQIGQINPNKKIALPCLLLIKTANNIKLQYNIRTKNSSVIHKGELMYLIEE